MRTSKESCGRVEVPSAAMIGHVEMDELHTSPLHGARAATIIASQNIFS